MSQFASLIELWGDARGRVVTFDDADDDGPVHIGRGPLQLLVRERKVFVAESDAVQINGRPSDSRQPLTDGDVVQLESAHFRFIEGPDLVSKRSSVLHGLAVRDGLTGLANPRALHEHLTREVGRSFRYRRPLSVLVIDLDRFMSFNDMHGLQAGDHVLRAVAALVLRHSHEEELVARFKGSAFVWCIAEAEAEEVAARAEALRRAVEEARFELEGTAMKITVSIGIARLDEEMAHGGELLDAAEEQAFEAKKAGRNRVEGKNRSS